MRDKNYSVFAKISFEKDVADNHIWATVSYSLRNDEGFMESFNVDVAITDFNISLTEVENIAVEKANRLIKAIAAELDN